MPVLFKKIEEKPKEFREAVASPFRNNREEQEKRRLTEGELSTPVYYFWTPREISPDIHRRMLLYVKKFYDSNPLARRIIEMTKNFILGEGIYFEAENKEVQNVLEEFWYDDINNWPIKQHERILELCLYGELFIPVSVNPRNGAVTLGHIDPYFVVRVIPDLNNPTVIDRIEAQIVPWDVERREFKVIRKDRDPFSPTYGKLSGEVFVFMINKTCNQLRGTSDLLPILDWLDAYDQFLFNRLERESFINNFVWDVTLEGADAEEIENFVKALQPPSPGTVRAHNERVKWEVIAPDLESGDAQKEAALIRAHILAGAGFPPHYFSDFSGVRATAYEAYFPTEKNLVARQKLVKAFIEYIFQFVIDQAIIHKRLPMNISTEFEVYFPEISIRDVERTARSFRYFMLGLAEAKEKGWLRDEECRKIVSSIISQIGVELEKKMRKHRIKVEEEDQWLGKEKPEKNLLKLR